MGCDAGSDAVDPVIAGHSRPVIGTRSAVGFCAAIARQPHLWGTALRQVFALAPTAWWRRWPPLPLPDEDYLAFRMETAYGSADVVPPSSDVVHYLDWCRRHRHISR